MDSRLLDQRKTLQSQIVAKSSEENKEFEKQRTAAIAEVAKTKEVNVVLRNSLQEPFYELANCYLAHFLHIIVSPLSLY